MTEVISKSVPVSDSENPDESPIYRNQVTILENGGNLISTFRSQPEANTPVSLLRGSAKKFSNKPCYGEREIFENGGLGRYKWISFSEAEQMVDNFGKGLLSIGFVKGDKLGIYSHNCPFWPISCYGCQVIGGIPVPIYDSLGPNAAQYIINHAEITTVIVHSTKLNILLETSKLTPKLETIIVIGKYSLVDSKYQIYSASDIVEIGKKSKIETMRLVPPDEIGIISYTSGSTGNPKGCVISHRNLVAGIAGFSCLGLSFGVSDILL
jgi:long-chain acyl-CoA synthetase